MNWSTWTGLVKVRLNIPLYFCPLGLVPLQLCCLQKPLMHLVHTEQTIKDPKGCSIYLCVVSDDNADMSPVNWSSSAFSPSGTRNNINTLFVSKWLDVCRDEQMGKKQTNCSLEVCK